MTCLIFFAIGLIIGGLVMRYWVDAIIIILRQIDKLFPKENERR